MSSNHLRIYLFSLILLALAFGMVYYMNQVDQNRVAEEGTLV